MDERNESILIQEAKKHFSALGLRFFLGSLVIYAVNIGVSAVVGTFWPQAYDNLSLTLVLSIVPMYLIGIPALYLIVRPVPTGTPGTGKLTAGWFITFLVLSYGFMTLTNLIGTYLGMFIELLVPSAQASTNAVQAVAFGGEIWINAIFMVLLAPVIEEFVFRKTLVDRTIQYGEGVSMLLSGLFFGLFHGNLTQFLYAFVMGAILSLLYARTGKIRYTIAIHMIVNFMGSVVGVLLIRAAGLSELMNQFLGDSSEGLGSLDMAAIMELAQDHAAGLALYLLFTCVVYGCMLAAVILLIVRHRQLRPLPGRTVIPKGKRFSTVICNPGVLILIVFYLVVIFFATFGNGLVQSISGLAG